MAVERKALVCNNVCQGIILVDTENGTYTPPEGCFLGDPDEWPYVPEEWPITTPEPDETQ
jgi:hypothetical protein